MSEKPTWFIDGYFDDDGDGDLVDKLSPGYLVMDERFDVTFAFAIEREVKLNCLTMADD